jgi:uncharacterized protein YegJ (DUF2314 family)
MEFAEDKEIVVVGEEEKNIDKICAVCAAKKRKLWQRQNQNLVISKGDFVKIGIRGKDKDSEDCVEHVWIELESIESGVYTGRIDNILVALVDFKHGDEISFKRKKIEDFWARPWWESYNEELTIEKGDGLRDVSRYYGGRMTDGHMCF